jgi:hypothetical protein
MGACLMYGTGTRSYNRSTEKRQMDRERAEYNRKIESGEIVFGEVVVVQCHCLSFRFSHSPADHKKLRSDMDWRTWQERQAEAERWREFPERIA